MTKIAIDFDGVICKSVGIPTEKLEWDKRKPVKDSLAAIIFLKKRGHNIWVFTANSEMGEVRKWLTKHKFPRLEVTNIKKPAHVYIDDRGLRFTNWQDMRKYFG